MLCEQFFKNVPTPDEVQSESAHAIFWLIPAEFCSLSITLTPEALLTASTFNIWECIFAGPEPAPNAVIVQITSMPFHRSVLFLFAS